MRVHLRTTTTGTYPGFEYTFSRVDVPTIVAEEVERDSMLYQTFEGGTWLAASPSSN